MTVNDLFAPVFEWGGILDRDLANAIYELNYYPVLGSVLVLMSLVGISLYYFPGSAFKARISRWYHWLIWSLILAFIVALVITFLARNEVEFSFANTITTDAYFMLFLISIVDSVVLTIIVSNLVRWFSTDLKSTPFPQ